MSKNEPRVLINCSYKKV